MHQMRQTGFILIYSVVILVLMILTACTPTPTEKSNHQIWLPWLTESGTYKIQKIPVNTVTEWSPLRGSAVQIRGEVRKVGVNTFSSKEVMMEHTVDLSGAIIPLTQFATELGSIYTHFERLQKLDKELQIPNADVIRKVYVRFMIGTKSGSLSVNGAFYDSSLDAFFILPYIKKNLPLSVNGGVLAHEHFHSIFARLISKPLSQSALSAESKKTQISKNKEKEITPPLLLSKKINIQSFSPHFGSKEFNEIMLEFQGDSGKNNSNSNSNSKLGSSEKSKESSTKTSFDPEIFVGDRKEFLNDLAMRGLNEGLADFWGWMYSGDPCFIEGSISKSETGDRCLNTDSKKVKFLDLDEAERKYSILDPHTENEEVNAYTLGSSVARMIYLRIKERGELKQPEAIRKWAQRIVKTLPQFLPEMKKVYVEEEKRKSVLQWSKIMDTLLFGPGSPSVSKENCDQWKGILKNNENLENFKFQCSKREDKPS